jgi:integrase
MPRLFRQSYTRAIPEGADIITMKGKRHARFQDEDGRTITAPLNSKGERIRLLSTKWYGEYLDADGIPRREPLSTDKVAAQQLLAELVRKAERGKAGILDPFEEHCRRPLLEHLTDFQTSLLADGDTADHAKKTTSRARRVLQECGFVFIPDISASAVQTFLADLRSRGRPRFDLPAGQDWFTKAEIVKVLGIHPAGLAQLLRRHGLHQTARGNGIARRYPRSTVLELQDRLCRGASITTSNHYLQAIKSFVVWLEKDRRTDDNPREFLSGGNPRTDLRHPREALEYEQLKTLLATATASSREFRGLAGRDRGMIYLTAMGTGFRPGELASLEPRSFALNADPPTVEVRAAYAKNRKAATQPVPPDVAEVLRGYLAGRPADQPVWPGSWVDGAADMICLDLEAAGIPYILDGPDGPVFIDFYAATRHSYITLLARSGVHPKLAQTLARHSTITLTMDRYTHVGLFDQAQALEALPKLTPVSAGSEAPALAATGTDDQSITNQGGIAYRLAYRRTEAEGGYLRLSETLSTREPGTDSETQHAETARLETDCDRLRAVEESGPSRIRTCNQGIMRTPDCGCNSLPAITSGESAPRHVPQHVPGEPIDPELARLVEAWPSLPLPIRAAIRALIDSTPPA